MKPLFEPPVPGERVFNLPEAAATTGKTSGWFYYEKNKAALEELGATTGKLGWNIPQSALEQLGLLPVGWQEGDKASKPLPDDIEVTELRRRLSRVTTAYELSEQQLSEATKRAAVAEARAASAEAALIQKVREFNDLASEFKAVMTQ